MTTEQHGTSAGDVWPVENADPDTYIDHYLSIEADEFAEAHIWANPSQASELKANLERVATDWGLEATVVIEGGGEYDWIVNSYTDLAKLAEEILTARGFFDERQA